MKANIDYNGVLITQKQLSVLRYMHKFLLENDHIPTRREITRFLNCAGDMSAQGYVVALVKKGLLEYLDDNTGRVRFVRD